MNSNSLDDETEDTVLLGTILKVPLIIEDEDTSQTIKPPIFGSIYREQITNQATIQIL